MDIYAQNIMDHYRHPRNHGALESPDATEVAVNTSCGDSLTVYLQFTGDRIQKISFTGQGCAISQAGISILSEELVGLDRQQVLALDFPAIKKIFGVALSERRYNCAMLGLQAIQGAIKKAIR